MSLRNMRTTFVVLAAVVIATVGVLRLMAAPDTSAAATGQSSVDSLTAQVTAADWTGMDHEMTPASGYQMPQGMMPGMPEDGEQRLAVKVTVVNTSGDTRPLRPGEEFVLRAGPEGRQWQQYAATFGELARLAPGNAVSGTLFFDLPPEELQPPAWVEWTHADTAIRLTLPINGLGEAPDHGHTP
jgi:hypothetical protein